MKPLYYCLTPQGTLVFGSEIKCLLLHPEVPRDTCPEAIETYLTLGYIPAPLCIFSQIGKLAPGCHLTFAKGRLDVRPYWDFNYEPAPARPAEEYIEELRYHLEEAVRIRMISDVPLGAFLSGGVDSSTVVAMMARHSSRPVKTFSIGFSEDSYDELKYARSTARHLGTDHHEFIVTPQICDVADDLVGHFDEPFADSSAIPTFMVSKLAREHVTVALTGDGGDEVFAGYTRYAVNRQRTHYGRVPKIVKDGLFLPLSRSLPHGAWGRNFLHNAALDPVERYLDSVSYFPGLSRAALTTEDFRRQLDRSIGAAALFGEYAHRPTTGAWLDALLYLDSKTYLPGDILTKVDRMSMAASLEARCPLLDTKLIDFVTTIPAALKMKGLETKYLFKQAVADFVPPEIVHRRKQGFGLPIRHWINNELRDRICDTLLDPGTESRGIIEPAYVRVLIDEHRRCRRDHSGRLWMLYMLELWHRQFCGASRPARFRAPHRSASLQTRGAA
jgi:asparagine synthase (glutamine-hydrolysing)